MRHDAFLEYESSIKKGGKERPRQNLTHNSYIIQDAHRVTFRVYSW